MVIGTARYGQEDHMQTVQQIREAVERGKALAAARIDRELGAGTFSMISAYSASEKSRNALIALATLDGGK